MLKGNVMSEMQARIDVNAGMDQIDESLDKAGCKEKYITEGNHDNWLNLAVEKYPYIPQYRFASAVKLADRGYKYVKFGKHLKMGKLYFYHGHQYGGQYHTANHIRKLGCNIMYGHECYTYGRTKISMEYRMFKRHGAKLK